MRTTLEIFGQKNFADIIVAALLLFFFFLSLHLSVESVLALTIRRFHASHFVVDDFRQITTMAIIKFVYSLQHSTQNSKWFLVAFAFREPQ